MTAAANVVSLFSEIGRLTPADRQNTNRRGAGQFKTAVVDFAMRTETFSRPKRGRNTKLGHAGIRPLNSLAGLGESRWGETKSGRRSAAIGRTDDP